MMLLRVLMMAVAVGVGRCQIEGEGEEAGHSEASQLQTRLNTLEATSDILAEKVEGHQASITSLRDAFQEMKQIVQQLSAQRTHHVAFNVRLDDDQHLHANDRQILKFPKVLLNVGSAYDTETGIFTAPAVGLYVFLFTTAAVDGRNHANAFLQVDGYGETAFVDNGQEKAGGFGVFHLNKGSRAWVAANHHQRYYYSYATTFLGFLLS